MELLYEGKAKKVFKTDNENEYIVYFKDDATAFNGEKKAVVYEKGILNNKISSEIFKMLHQKGINNHFIKRISDREMLVKKVDIIPLEVIVRNIAAGSICKRLGIKEGKEFKKSIIEFSYKNDEYKDPLINEDHIIALEIITEDEIQIIKNYAAKINEILKEFFIGLNIVLVDFKLEFGKYGLDIILADEISPDTCRLWDKDSMQKLDKDRFRQDLGQVIQAYKQVLERIEK
ncbi:phosphoribosylaminoimidazole-succinocarboxamide synthase [Alkalithermobacter thermoalcaliphilus JW-YL-7 = DSM 7308]|uniref:Phosphoribosylaminoimidazole-succinocarboxamide synthase n=1 Tax=Alkalithermobacter thermoalcaliphilus JW-YL-7 = DSM 7308 TaxID=1121328 RepID=A0A150FNB2_CLOPD|nr:Phosphoribosylaminoimidazole-succinocarboxamide synthase [[Clostridium] paradoxum JW-YL-7 = DSM 7308]SHK90775.1 phosphoribosylaminoimidazole-succinocarboxamide synthase [[Clostridium] paradoxum JW-YL-7 = DSM 7308]